jgi:hypothetical protein
MESVSERALALAQRRYGIPADLAGLALAGRRGGTDGAVEDALDALPAAAIASPGAAAFQRAAEVDGMDETFEYEIVCQARTKLRQTLQQMGAEGWRAIHIQAPPGPSNSDAAFFTVILERRCGA